VPEAVVPTVVVTGAVVVVAEDVGALVVGGDTTPVGVALAPQADHKPFACVRVLSSARPYALTRANGFLL